MTTLYDVDNPPEESSYSITGKVITSSYVSSPEEAGLYDSRLADSYRKFVEAFARDNNLPFVPCWLIRVQAVDVVYAETGEPLVLSQLVRLVDKSGKPLSRGQAPDLLATQFRKVCQEAGLDYTASPAASGTPKSVVSAGTVFLFEETVVPLGRGYEKTFRLWPVSVVPEEEAKSLPVREISPRSDSKDIQASINGSGTISEQEAQTYLISVLNGKRPAAMLGAILEEPALKGVSTVFGVNLIEAAADESLASILVSQGLMTVDDGTLKIKEG